MCFLENIDKKKSYMADENKKDNFLKSFLISTLINAYSKRKCKYVNLKK